MKNQSVFDLHSEGQKLLIKNMILAYPGHFVMPVAIYFLTSMPQVHPLLYWPFTILALLNSTSHMLLGLTYPLSRRKLGDKAWNNIYKRTLIFEAVTFSFLPVYFSFLGNLWSIEGLFSIIVWVIGLEGFAKFCYHHFENFKLALFTLVLPMTLMAPYNGTIGFLIAGFLVAYSVVVYQGASVSNKQALDLYEAHQKTKLGEQKLKDLLAISSFYIFEVNQHLEILDASRNPSASNTPWVFPKELKNLIKKFNWEGKETEIAELELSLEKEQKWYQIFLRKSPDNENTIIVITDIHTQKLAEVELENQRAHQMSTAKLAALGEMAGGIAHEINNPLTIVSGNLYKVKRLIKKPELDKEGIFNAIAKAEETISRIGKIVVGLKNLSITSDIDKETEFYVSSLFEDAQGIFNERFHSKGIQITFLIGEPTLALKMNYQQVGQILINLINNAFDAVLDQDKKAISIEATAEHQEIVFKIKDSGKGPSDPEKMFNPFFTTKDVGEGTGLGLSLSRKTAENLGGKLSFYREEEATVFELRLPRFEISETAVS